MKCDNCKTENDSDAKFCVGCGKSISEGVLAGVSSQIIETKFRGMALSAALMAVYFLGYMIVLPQFVQFHILIADLF